MNLYEINKEWSEILEDLYDDEGNVNEQSLMKLEHNELSLEKKVVAIASFIENLKAHKNSIEEAKKAMTKREAQCKKKINELEEYLQSNMERRGITNIKCPYFDIKLVKSPPSVNVENETLIPKDYFKTKIEYSLDKAKMLFEMKNGVVISGAKLKQKMRLQIK